MSIDAEKIEQAAIILKSGGVVIHPTETVYGIAAVWNNEEALGRAAKLKKRDLQKPFSILVNQVDPIMEITGWQNPELGDLLENIFPAPLTILLPRKKELSLSFWNQFPAIGFRMSDFDLCMQLVKMTGVPLITTSANVANQAPPKSADLVDSTLVERVDLFLDGGDCPLQIPSTVLRFNPDTLEVSVLRQGAFSPEVFEESVNRFYSK